MTISTSSMELKFRFKLSEEDKKLGKENPREQFVTKVEVPDADGIVAIAQAGGKELDLLRDAMAAIIATQARSQINELIDKDASVVLAADSIDAAKLSWSFIANMPPKERAGSEIPKEIWDAFAADYISIMPELTGKPKEAAQTAAAVFLKKMLPAKTRKDMLPIFQNRLDTWVANSTLLGEESENAEQFAAIYQFLSARIKDYIEAEVVLTNEAI